MKTKLKSKLKYVDKELHITNFDKVFFDNKNLENSTLKNFFEKHQSDWFEQVLLNYWTTWGLCVIWIPDDVPLMFKEFSHAIKNYLQQSNFVFHFDKTLITKFKDIKSEDINERFKVNVIFIEEEELKNKEKVSLFKRLLDNENLIFLKVNQTKKLDSFIKEKIDYLFDLWLTNNQMERISSITNFLEFEKMNNDNSTFLNIDKDTDSILFDTISFLIPNKEEYLKERIDEENFDSLKLKFSCWITIKNKYWDINIETPIKKEFKLFTKHIREKTLNQFASYYTKNITKIKINESLNFYDLKTKGGLFKYLDSKRKEKDYDSFLCDFYQRGFLNLSSNLFVHLLKWDINYNDWIKLKNSL